MAVYITKSLPAGIEKLTQLHNASTKQPLFYLNVFFGLGLLFFVISSFWMFLPFVPFITRRNLILFGNFGFIFHDRC